MWDCVAFFRQSKGVFNYDFYRTRSQVSQAPKFGILWENFPKIPRNTELEWGTPILTAVNLGKANLQKIGLEF